MHLHHKAGEKLYVDFAGMTIKVRDREKPAQIFVATMGFSRYVYAEAVPDQTLRSLLARIAGPLSFSVLYRRRWCLTT